MSDQSRERLSDHAAASERDLQAALRRRAERSAPPIIAGASPLVPDETPSSATPPVEPSRTIIQPRPLPRFINNTQRFEPSPTPDSRPESPGTTARLSQTLKGLHPKNWRLPLVSRNSVAGRSVAAESETPTDDPYDKLADFAENIYKIQKQHFGGGRANLSDIYAKIRPNLSDQEYHQYIEIQIFELVSCILDSGTAPDDITLRELRAVLSPSDYNHLKASLKERVQILPPSYEDVEKAENVAKWQEEVEKLDFEIAEAIFDSELERSLDQTADRRLTDEERKFVLARAWSKLEQKTFLGKKVTDILTDTGFGFASGVVVRLVFGATGLSVGTWVAGLATGAIKGGYQEVQRQHRLAETEDPALRRRKILEKLKAADRKQLALAVGKGALFGLVGSVVGAEVAGLFKNAVGLPDIKLLEKFPNMGDLFKPDPKTILSAPGIAVTPESTFESMATTTPEPTVIPTHTPVLNEPLGLSSSDELQRQLQEANQANNLLKEDVKAWADNARAWQENALKVHADLDQAETDLKGAGQRITELTKQLEAVQHDKVEGDALVSQLQQQNDTLAKEIAGLKAQIDHPDTSPPVAPTAPTLPESPDINPDYDSAPDGMEGLPKEVYELSDGDVTVKPGSNTWNETRAILMKAFNQQEPSDEQILKITKLIAKDSGVRVPEWGLTTGTEQHILPPGYILIVSDETKRAIAEMARNR